MVHIIFIDRGSQLFVKQLYADNRSTDADSHNMYRHARSTTGGLATIGFAEGAIIKGTVDQ